MDEQLYTLELDENYESSLFFLGNFWNSMAARFSAPPAAIFAARGHVIFADSDNEDAMNALRRNSASESETSLRDAPERIWLWQDDGWQPYGPVYEETDHPS